MLGTGFSVVLQGLLCKQYFHEIMDTTTGTAACTVKDTVAIDFDILIFYPALEIAPNAHIL